MEIVRYPLLAAGVGFTIYGLLGLLRSFGRRRVCDGVIIGYERHEEHSLFAPKVQFLGSDGRIHTFTSQLYDSQDVAVGGTIRIRYSPAQPERAEVDCFSALWLFPLVWLSFGIAFLLVSIYVPHQDA